MSDLPTWIATHGATIAIILGGLVLALGLACVVVWIGKRFYDLSAAMNASRLKNMEVIEKQRRVKRDSSPELDLKSHIKELSEACEGLEREATMREKLMRAQEENLNGRDQHIRDLTAKLEGANEDKEKLGEDIDRLREKLNESEAALAKAREEIQSLQMIASMLEKQAKATEANTAMLQATVTDLNAKRDLLTQEVQHLKSMESKRMS